MGGEPDVHPSLEPLGWMVGTWIGVGVGGYPTVESFRFAQEIEVVSDGRPLLTWRSRSWLLDDDGRRTRPGAGETGFWRPGASGDDGPASVELLLAHATGHVEIYYGAPGPRQVEVATDLVAGTSTAKQVGASTRLYGQVDDDLAWVLEMAAVGRPLQPHLSARLSRQG